MQQPRLYPVTLKLRPSLSGTPAKDSVDCLLRRLLDFLVCYFARDEVDYQGAYRQYPER